MASFRTNWWVFCDNGDRLLFRRGGLGPRLGQHAWPAWLKAKGMPKKLSEPLSLSILAALP